LLFKIDFESGGYDSDTDESFVSSELL
jgi:hypothetical protein